MFERPALWALGFVAALFLAGAVLFCGLALYEVVRVLIVALGGSG